jgi:hypothetical protein
MNIYTFYEEIEDINKEEQKEMIDIWKESWSKFGWNPIVLSNSDTSLSDEQYKLISNLPTVNNPIYEITCYLRWNAMSNIGGGWMSDYDVINCGFTPEDSLKYESISILQGHVPCLVFGTSEDYSKIFEIFYKEGQNKTTKIGDKNHTSDMIILSLIINDYEFIKSLLIVDDYPSENVLIHCSTDHCRSNNISKIDSMKKLTKII